MEEVREEAAPRLPVTKAAWRRPPHAPVLCDEEGQGAAAGKSCSSPRRESAKGRPGAGRGRGGGLWYAPGLGQRGRSCANKDAVAGLEGAAPMG